MGEKNKMKKRRRDDRQTIKTQKDWGTRLFLKLLSIAIAPMIIGTSFSANASNTQLSASESEQEAERFSQRLTESGKTTSGEPMPAFAKLAKTRKEAADLVAQLAASNSTISYDPWGRLARIIEPDASVRQFGYSGDRLCEERDGSGAITKQFFNWGEMIGSTKYFYTRDHLGSVTEMTDQSGNVVAQYRYDSWGNVTKIAGSGPDSDFLYAGYFYHKPSGLYITRHRLYSPKLARWLNRDPIDDSTLAMMPENPEKDAAPENESASGAPLNANFLTFHNAARNLVQTSTQTINTYKYANNNPISKVDPSGLRVDDMGPTPCPVCTNDCNAHPANCHLGRRWSQQQNQWLYTIYFVQTAAAGGKTCTAYPYNGWDPFNQSKGYCTWLCN